MKVNGRKSVTIAVIGMLVVTGIVVVYLLLSRDKSSSGGIITKDPAGVMLGPADLPQGWSIEFEKYYSPPDTYAKKYNEWGFENGFEREFKKGTAYLTSRAERFSTVDGAKKAYEYWLSVANSMVPYGYAANVEHDTVGDQSFFFQFFSTSHAYTGYSAMFKKSNFLVNVIYNRDNVDELTISDIIGYLQTSEGRLR